MLETFNNMRPEKEAISGSAAPPLILVVDDDVTVRSMAEFRLMEAGYRVLCLSDGKDVVKTFCAENPDAVLLDVMLPDSDGYTICRALREIPKAEHVPIVMLTSLEDEDAIRKAFDAGATEFVQKPAVWVNEAYRLRYLLRAAANMKDLDAAHDLVSRGKQEWEETFEAIDNPIMLLSPDLTIVRANQATARMAHLKMDEILGEVYRDVFGFDQTAGETCAAVRAMTSGTVESEEVSHCGPGQRTCLASASPVLGAEGRPRGVVYSLKDITDLRKLEQEFLHAQKMDALGVLAGGIAHDFNNLLQGIMGFAELMGVEENLSPEVRDGLAQIQNIAEQGRGLTRQLLLTSRKDATRLGPLEVEPVVQQTAEMLKRTIPRTITKEVVVASDVWKIRGDASHLQQVLINLAINASHAMGDGGALCIRAENVMLDESYCSLHPGCHAGPHVLIAVSDTGGGMTQEVMEKMYEPFFTTKTPGKGTGLGLAVVFGIVRDHGGHMCCYSEPGEGTTFRIYLPALVGQAPAPVEPVQAERPSALTGDGHTILLIEDEPQIRMLVGSFLNRFGYEVICAIDGLDGLEQYDAEKDRIDAIVLDMNMPRMNGESCLKELEERNCKIPVLLATGALFSSKRQQELLNYACAIVAKPFDIEGLVRKLAEAIQQSSARG